MLAGIYSDIGKIDCREVKTPEIGDFDVLVKVRAASICGTDIKIYNHGHHALKEGDERILGHEFSGEVVEVGKKVRGYEIGMRVGVEPNIGCGRCTFCRKGLISLCQEYRCLGITMDGAFAEYVKIEDMAVIQGNIVVFDEGTGFEEAALAEPLACCYNGFESVRTVPGDYVLIVGAGPIGLLHLQLQRLAGAGRLMIADIAPEKLEFAWRFNPDVVINSKEEDLFEAVMDHTGGRGADVVITACPVPDIQRLSLRLAAKKGRVCLFGGLPKGSDSVDLDTNLLHYNSIVLTGTTGSTVAQYERALSLISDNRIDVKPLVSRRFMIDEIEEAFGYAASGKGMRTIISFQGPD
ncbi:MAG TPA: zinc-dependent dehydrogenase [Spirochaetota bacterium]|nr:zinc-dependent dehydrogenase [Spirochaetota bacterium]